MSVIDAHHHVWDLAVREQPWLDHEELAPIRRTFTLDDLRPAAVAAGVTGTVLVQTVTVAAETPELLLLADTDPLVAGVVGWTDLTAPNAYAEIASLQARRGGRYLTGIRHQVQSEPDKDWLRGADVVAGLRAVAAAGLAYDLVVLPHQIPAATYAARAVPDLVFVLDHAGKPAIGGGGLGSWRADIAEFAAQPNTVCKLSGLVTEAPLGAVPAAFAEVAHVVLEAFGPDRVMFGSDWPVCLLASDYAGVLTLARLLVAGLSAAERNAVFCGTAARVYRITEGVAGVAGTAERA